MNDLIPIVKIDGKIIIDKKNIYDKDVGACCRGKQMTAYGYIWKFKD